MGLPPTTTKGSTDSSASTTFNIVSRKFPITHSGTTGTIDTIPGLPKNYIQNCDFEGNVTTGWSLFNTTLTSAIPTGSISAGAASITTFATTSSGPLAGTYSLQTSIASGTITAGQGFITDNLTLDSEDKAKVIQISFSYSATTGSSLMNFSGTSSNTWAVYVYDNANSAWIQPAGVYNIVQGSGVGKCTATFQTPSNATTVRLAIICINSNSSGAVAMLWDSFYFGPQIVTQGAAITDWVSYTPTGSWSTNTTYTGQWRRVGDSAEIQFKIALAGAPTSAALTVNLPSGMTIDTTKLSSSANPTVLGHASISDTGVQYYESYVGYSSTTAVALYVMTRSVTYVEESTAVTQAVPMTFGSTDYIYGTFKVPIVGWSSNVQLSSDTDTRVVAARVYKNGTQAISAETKITSFTVDSDKTGMWDAANNRFNILVSGDYVLSWFSYSTGTAAQATAYKVNGGSTVYLPGMPGGTVDSRVGGSVVIPNLVAGNYIELYQYTSASVTVQAGNTNTYASLHKLSGPAVIAASESVNAAYAAAGGQSISTGSVTKVDFATKEFDSHSAFSGNNTYTIPVSGKYLINGIVTINSGTTTTGTRAIYVYKNGSAVRTLSFATNYLTGTNYTTSVSALLGLLAGDTIDIRYLQNITAAETTTSNSFFQIHRTGN